MTEYKQNILMTDSIFATLPNNNFRIGV